MNDSSVEQQIFNNNNENFLYKIMLFSVGYRIVSAGIYMNNASYFEFYLQKKNNMVTEGGGNYRRKKIAVNII